MIYANPGQPDAVINFKDQYGNYIGGEWVAPVSGRYLDNVSPVNGEVFCQVARSDAADIDKALDAAHSAAVGQPLMAVASAMFTWATLSDPKCPAAGQPIERRVAGE